MFQLQGEQLDNSDWKSWVIVVLVSTKGALQAL